MTKDNEKLLKNILEIVSQQVKQSLNEMNEPAVEEQSTYIIMCSGIDKEVMNQLSAKLHQFDDYRNGSIRIICKGHDEVNKTISLLVDLGALDSETFMLHPPKISIVKLSRNSVNDSVNEDEDTIDDVTLNEEKGGRAVAYQYIPMNNIKVPRQRVKLDIILKINGNEIPRTPEAIRAEMDKSGLWETRTPQQIQMDIDLIMRKTAAVEEISGDFETDYLYSPYAEDITKFASPIDAAKNHVKWLIKHGLDVQIEEKKYVFKIFIHYSNAKQLHFLIQWLAWHLGETDTVNNPCPKEEKQYYEDLVKSGKFTTY